MDDREGAQRSAQAEADGGEQEHNAEAENDCLPDRLCPRLSRLAEEERQDDRDHRENAGGENGRETEAEGQQKERPKPLI